MTQTLRKYFKAHLIKNLGKVSVSVSEKDYDAKLAVIKKNRSKNKCDCKCMSASCKICLEKKLNNFSKKGGTWRKRFELAVSLQKDRIDAYKHEQFINTTLPQFRSFLADTFLEESANLLTSVAFTELLIYPFFTSNNVITDLIFSDVLKLIVKDKPYFTELINLRFDFLRQCMTGSFKSNSTQNGGPAPTFNVRTFGATLESTDKRELPLINYYPNIADILWFNLINFSSENVSLIKDPTNGEISMIPILPFADTLNPQLLFNHVDQCLKTKQLVYPLEITIPRIVGFAMSPSDAALILFLTKVLAFFPGKNQFDYVKLSSYTSEATRYIKNAVQFKQCGTITLADNLKVTPPPEDIELYSRINDTLDYIKINYNLRVCPYVEPALGVTGIQPKAVNLSRLGSARGRARRTARPAKPPTNTDIAFREENLVCSIILFDATLTTYKEYCIHIFTQGNQSTRNIIYRGLDFSATGVQQVFDLEKSFNLAYRVFKIPRRDEFKSYTKTVQYNLELVLRSFKASYPLATRSIPNKNPKNKTQIND